MSIHRGMAVAAALTLTLITTSCTSDDKPDPKPPTGSPTSASPTPAQASEDPGVQAVPLAGDKHLKIQWSLDKGVNGSDPVVDVGRRTLAAVYLATFSPEWRSDAAIGKVSASLTTGDDVLLEPTRSARSGKQPVANDPLVITVQPPQVDGDTAVFWACVDARGAFDHTPTRRNNIGILASVSVTAKDGVWKATRYDLDPQDPTSDDRYYQRCQQDK
ncbi:hypothetical protein [Aeromicrobium sp. Root236]|uniref:hypothetical protein n=1 Tax=Aeromicrobium sp. Root236 TaxID=1736498 RepID=UPI000A966411|nr:hypothetical protein [Aeromicrobium sp. Root236]